MKKIVACLLGIVLFFCFILETKASEVLKEVKILEEATHYKVEKNKSTMDLEFIKDDVDFYYINICEKTNDKVNCKNEPKIYTEAFTKGEKKVTLAFRNEGVQGIEIAMKDKKGNFKGIIYLIADISNKTYLEHSFVAPKEDVFIKELLKTKFKGFEKWNASVKVSRVHQYIAKNYKYDYDLYEKINEIDFNNPDLVKLKNEKIGICYDLAALNAGILRAMGVPTKVEVGKAYSKGKLSGYHAWNAVYINKQWKIVDPTWDLGKSFSYKKQEDYIMHHEF